MDAQRKRPPLTDGLSKTTQAHNTTALAYVKRAIVQLALWGLLAPTVATWLIKALGLRHA